MRGPGSARGYYRGHTFYYLVKCVCGWRGYRAWPRYWPCPRCGAPNNQLGVG